MTGYKDTQWLLQRYEEAKTLRAPFENDYRRLAAFCMPGDYQYWQQPTTGQPLNTSASSAALQVFDSTAKRAVPKFATICHRLCTPKSQIWHKLRADSDELMRIRAVQLYFQELNDRLWKRRYEPRAMFSAAQTENYAALGVYGTGTKYIALRDKTALHPRRSFGYRSVHLRDIFVLVDEWGTLYALFRRLFLNARQAKAQFASAGEDALPPSVRAELKKPNPSEAVTFEFVQVVMPREDYDAQRMDARRYPLASVYMCVSDKCSIGDPSGYSSWPYILSRHFTTPGGIYGVSPASFAIDAMGSASAMKKTLLKQGQKAVDPPLLAHDDGVVNGNVDLRPGAINYGGVDSQGRPLIHALPPGNFQWGETLLADERSDIDDAFFVKLFQILVDTPEMTATEVMERTAEKSALLAPTMERMQSEDLGPTIERELDLLGQMNDLPEMPPELQEAAGEYTVLYTSPLARQQKAEQVSGFARIVQMATEAAQATQSSKPLRRINFDTAIPEIADIMSVPATWLHSDAEVEAMDAQDQQQQQVQQLADAAPAIAGMAKAMQPGTKAPA